MIFSELIFLVVSFFFLHFILNKWFHIYFYLFMNRGRKGGSTGSDSGEVDGAARHLSISG